MPTGIEAIKNSLTRISQGTDLIDFLVEFERTLDNTELYAYKNWELGELVHGPEVSRYWFKTSWMYPYRKMPDPRGGMRLLKIGCKVGFGRDVFKKPVRVLEPADWEDIKTKKAKMDTIPVWVVHIEMPMKYITDNIDLIDDLIRDELDKETEVLAQEFGPEEETDEFGGEDEFGGDEDFGALPGEEEEL